MKSSSTKVFGHALRFVFLGVYYPLIILSHWNDQDATSNFLLMHTVFVLLVMFKGIKSIDRLKEAPEIGPHKINSRGQVFIPGMEIFVNGFENDKVVKKYGQLHYDYFIKEWFIRWDAETIQDDKVYTWHVKNFDELFYEPRKAEVRYPKPKQDAVYVAVPVFKSNQKS